MAIHIYTYNRCVYCLSRIALCVSVQHKNHSINVLHLLCNANHLSCIKWLYLCEIFYLVYFFFSVIIDRVFSLLAEWWGIQSAPCFSTSTTAYGFLFRLYLNNSQCFVGVIVVVVVVISFRYSHLKSYLSYRMFD